MSELNPEKKGFRLLDHGPRKMDVVKTIQAYTGLGLKEAKEASEQKPWFFKSVKGCTLLLKGFKEALEEDGAKVEWVE